MQTSDWPQVNFRVARIQLLPLGECQNVTFNVLYVFLLLVGWD
jgi:hypothetical protein